MPLAFIMIGDMFTFEQRADAGLLLRRMGRRAGHRPLLGGFLVDNLLGDWPFM